jgi:hypothetical protein
MSFDLAPAAAALFIMVVLISSMAYLIYKATDDDFWQ